VSSSDHRASEPAILRRSLAIVMRLTASAPVRFVPEQLHVALVWNVVVHYRCRHDAPFPRAVHAKRIALQEQPARFLPSTVVSARMGARPTVIDEAIALAVSGALMFGTSSGGDTRSAAAFGTGP
jgi:hypothetical protein